MIAPTDHVLLAHEKLGHKDLSEGPAPTGELLMHLERAVGECGFIIEKTVTIKTDDLRVRLVVRQPTEAEQDMLPLQFTANPPTQFPRIN